MTKLRWVINPPVDMVEKLSDYGRFLADDYRMIIQHLYIPETFSSYEGKTNRKFVIIGGKENPMLIAKTVFLCIKLSGAENISVKTYELDEAFIVNNILENHSDTFNYQTFVPHHDNLNLDRKFMDAVEQATDIVVFGDAKKVKAFKKYENIDRRVWAYSNKISFGVVRANKLTITAINEICFDFFAFYGEGRLSPKFYFIIGELNDELIQDFSNNVIALYRPMIEEYRDKLPITAKSKLVDLFIKSNYKAPYVRVNYQANQKTVFDKLYGDVKLIQVDSIDDVEEFIKDYKEMISTIAVDLEDESDIIDLLEEMNIGRICSIGDMQFPDFYEPTEVLDDFQIYVSEDDGNNYY
jgi:hypothetical protein